MEDRKTMRSKIMFVRKTLQVVIFVLSLGVLITTTHLGGQVVGFFEGSEWNSQRNNEGKIEFVVHFVDPRSPGTISSISSSSPNMIADANVVSVFLLLIFLINQLKRRRIFGVLNLLLLALTIYEYCMMIDSKRSYVNFWSPYNDWLIMILQIDWICYVAVITMFFTELTIVLMNCIYREKLSLPYN